MSIGTLYGIGVGAGDSDWLTVKAAKILARCPHVCVPRSRVAADSVALDIARPHLGTEATIHEITFPMSSDARTLHQSWQQAALEVYDILKNGQDCAFLTLGDALLYSTYIYLLRELRRLDAGIPVVTVPGITAFSAAAALTNFPIGEGKQIVTIVPAADDFAPFCRALDGGGTVVLMKVGKRLQKVLEELDRRGLAEKSVFVSKAGMPDQRIETDLSKLRGASEETGYLSIMLIQTGDAPGAGAKQP